MSGHTASAIRRQRAMNAGAQLAVSSLVIQSAAWPMGRHCPLVANVGLLTSVHTKQELPPRHAQCLVS